MRSEGSPKSEFDKNVVRLAKVFTSHYHTSTGLSHRDPSLRAQKLRFMICNIFKLRLEQPEIPVSQPVC